MSYHETTCDSCKFNERSWDEEPCNSCTFGGDSNYFTPAAQKSRIENALHGKSAEEQYDFIWWLMRDYGMQFTDARAAVIEWLRGEHNG